MTNLVLIMADQMRAAIGSNHDLPDWLDRPIATVGAAAQPCTAPAISSKIHQQHKAGGIT
jgi:hypothetical protein